MSGMNSMLSGLTFVLLTDRPWSCTIGCYTSHDPAACGASRSKMSVVALLVLFGPNQVSALFQEQHQQVGGLQRPGSRCDQARGALLARTCNAHDS